MTTLLTGMAIVAFGVIVAWWTRRGTDPAAVERQAAASAATAAGEVKAADVKRDEELKTDVLVDINARLAAERAKRLKGLS